MGAIFDHDKLLMKHDPPSEDGEWLPVWRVIKNNGHTRNHAHPTACIWQCTSALLHPIIPGTLSWGTLQQHQQETVGTELGVQNQLLTSLSFHDTGVVVVVVVVVLFVCLFVCLFVVFSFFSALSVRLLIQPVSLAESKMFEHAQ